ncbi:MAG TPA: glycosyltransferase family 2 protein [Vicinamibacterales bacterium]|nr:glycosyltransferase family 2 protein [Vicinamibacterales bacterium]
MPGLTVTVITKNEAPNLAAALESVTWADEIVVVDSGSSDGTTAIARRFTPRVVERAFAGYGEQKNQAASLASHDWILSLDADERVSPALGEEIRALLRVEPPARGYRIPRVTFHLGRWIRTTDWYPDFQLRLYDRRAGRWSERLVHESVQLDGRPGYLSGELQHYPYRDLAAHLETIDRYTTLAAEQMHRDGARPGVVSIAVHPPLAFLRNYILRRGLLDGAAGLKISALNAYYVYLKFAKARRLSRQP